MQYMPVPDEIAGSSSMSCLQ